MYASVDIALCVCVCVGVVCVCVCESSLIMWFKHSNYCWELFLSTARSKECVNVYSVRYARHAVTWSLHHCNNNNNCLVVETNKNHYSDVCVCVLWIVYVCVTHAKTGFHTIRNSKRLTKFCNNMNNHSKKPDQETIGYISTQRSVKEIISFKHKRWKRFQNR